MDAAAGDASRPLDAPETRDAGSPEDAGSDAASARLPRLTIDDFEYLGAFRVSSEDFGGSSTNYSAGTIGYHAGHSSLFLAGLDESGTIAEWPIPSELGTASRLEDLPLVEAPLQEFHSVFDRPAEGNPDALDRVTGLYVYDGDLIVNGNARYNAPPPLARDTTLVVRDADLSGAVEGYLELDGAARAAGFMSDVPAEWREALGGPVVAGWASNYSIVSRYSVGPTLFVFDPSDVTGAAAPGPVATRGWMDFDFEGGPEGYLDPDALETTCSVDDAGVTSCIPEPGASPMWNFVSRAVYGFIVPGTRTYAVFGSTGGLESGIGYKITQDNGNLCAGYCPYRADDVTNYYWFFDVEEILAAASPSAPRPYAYGAWSVPFDDGGIHPVIGGAYAPDPEVLYVTLGAAGQVGEYDRPPLIVAYRPNVAR